MKKTRYRNGTLPFDELKAGGAEVFPLHAEPVEA
jgi:hypothetical protein